MIDRSSSARCVQKLGALDVSFSQEYDETLRDAAEFPHAVMMLFAGHLARKFEDTQTRNKLLNDYQYLINNTLSVLEQGLKEGNADLHSVIVDSFIEQVFDENLWLFNYLLEKAGPLLSQEMTIYKKINSGEEKGMSEKVE